MRLILIVLQCPQCAILQLLSPELMDRRVFGVTSAPGCRSGSCSCWPAVCSARCSTSVISTASAPRLYGQHFYFDFIAGLGGYWASSFCQHWYHRVPLFILIDGLTTLALVTLVG